MTTQYTLNLISSTSNSNNFNIILQNNYFIKILHTIEKNSFALKPKIRHVNKTHTVKLVFYFQAPTIPIPSRKT